MSLNIKSTLVNSEFLQLQEANNFVKAAYKELMTMAYEAKTWVVGTPAVGSVEDFLSIFQSSPPSGMRAECSIESAFLPISPGNLITILMEPSQWPSLLPNIVLEGSSHAPTGVFQWLDDDNSRTFYAMVDAEFQLPTPFVPTRKFRFLRCLKMIPPGVWVIVDLSEDYFIHTPYSTMKNRRRPSGIIIRTHGDSCEVIWIESVEVDACLDQNNIFLSMVNSNLAFCAKRWVSTFLQRLKRSVSSFTNLKIPVDHQAQAVMLKLTDCMEMIYFNCVSEAPSAYRWDIISDQGVRILWDKAMYNSHTLGCNTFVGLTSFRVPVKPLRVFNFLVKRKLELQWPSLLNAEEPEEVIKLVAEDDSNCITLHRKVVPQNESTERYEYILQEASKEEFCSFVISSPITQSHINAAFSSGMITKHLKPSGFAIMPDGSEGLESDASLVTIAVQQDLDAAETSRAIEAMRNVIIAMIKEIKEVTSDGKTSSQS
ncbi:homeobox-leucine zipper protein ROC2-like isoform X2 [Mangifera indica]|uniref:homeobox-leucine zipper protein ROC2-like isoform X2 n=1 Tax=Mangifera indica TaxID=29780 RepID=UPI001CFC1242|nr:homeobox-leucine zipper protein ROC2-like isoform X2 [Mangifera indica]